MVTRRADEASRSYRRELNVAGFPPVLEAESIRCKRRTVRRLRDEMQKSAGRVK